MHVVLHAGPSDVGPTPVDDEMEALVVYHVLVLASVVSATGSVVRPEVVARRDVVAVVSLPVVKALSEAAVFMDCNSSYKPLTVVTSAKNSMCSIVWSSLSVGN